MVPLDSTVSECPETVVPDHVQCVSCGVVLLGLVLEEADPRPLGHDACPKCGGSEFALPDEDRDEE